MDYGKVCRLCLNEGKLSSSTMKHREASLSVHELIEFCLQIFVAKVDDLPKKICIKCKFALNKFYKFKRLCLENQKKFEGCLKTSDESKVEESFADKFNSTENDLSTQKNDETHYINSDNLLSKTAGENAASNTNSLRSNKKPAIDPNSLQSNEKPPIEHTNFHSKDCVEITNKPVIDLQLNTPVGNPTIIPVHPLHHSRNHTSSVEKPSCKEKSADLENSDKLVECRKNFCCDCCGKILSSKTNLVQHMRKHSGIKPHQCDFCQKAFGRLEHLTTHRRIHTGEKPHVCKICEKSFVQHAALSAHMRTHNGDRPHMCAICGKTFAQAQSLTYHTRTHTGETPYNCTICPKAFSHSGNLKIHMRFHQNERPYTCSVCERKFVTSSNLAVHSRQHTGVKPYECTICDKAFVRSEHLKDHLVIHSGLKPFGCKVCSKKYTQASHLTRHMKVHRNDSDT